jgi:hypothetical protein
MFTAAGFQFALKIAAPDVLGSEGRTGAPAGVAHSTALFASLPFPRSRLNVL